MGSGPVANQLSDFSIADGVAVTNDHAGQAFANASAGGRAPEQDTILKMKFNAILAGQKTPMSSKSFTNTGGWSPGVTGPDTPTCHPGSASVGWRRAIAGAIQAIGRNRRLRAWGDLVAPTGLAAGSIRRARSVRSARSVRRMWGIRELERTR
jgi:hypothetical protein